MDDSAFLDATAQADLVRRKQVKPIELVDAAIDRIERLHPTLNAVVTPMYDEARRAATPPTSALPPPPAPPLSAPTRNPGDTSRTPGASSGGSAAAAASGMVPAAH